jgi:hypothetical protein
VTITEHVGARENGFGKTTENKILRQQMILELSCKAEVSAGLKCDGDEKQSRKASCMSHLVHTTKLRLTTTKWRNGERGSVQMRYHIRRSRSRKDEQAEHDKM